MEGLGWDIVRDALRLRPATRVDEAVSTRAAVAAVIREARGRLELLFIRRAEQEGDPWSGHVSFPGGRSEPGDVDLLATAIRETDEETAICLDRDGELMGRLDEIRAMARGRPVDLVITPFVFRLLRHVDTRPNHEVVSVHWLPIARLLAADCRSTMEYPHEGASLQLPCLRTDGLVIWGLTYRMFDNLGRLLATAWSPPGG